VLILIAPMLCLNKRASAPQLGDFGVALNAPDRPREARPLSRAVGLSSVAISHRDETADHKRIGLLFFREVGGCL
jgi:hypothetical protein